MAGFCRCTICRGYLHHSFNTESGIAVYRCTGEDAWNDKGRYFIFAGGDTVEVEPTAERKGKGKVYGYMIVDTENRRRKQDADKINADLEARQKAYRRQVADMFDKAKYTERYDKDED